MASVHEASCACGYHTSFNVGGLRGSFGEHSYFPFLCNSCGLVEVNVADATIRCPSCKTTNIDQYGTKNVSDLKLDRSWSFPKIQNIHREAFEDGHKCPSCSKLTLVFSSANEMYD